MNAERCAGSRGIKTDALGVIPARYQSTRFPGKSLASLLGKPLIQWVFERASQATRLAALVIATDDERILQAAVRFGAKAIMTRPDHESGTDRVAEAAAGFGARIVVNIQGDEPLIEPSLIDAVVAALQESGRWDMATAATPIADDRESASPNVCKVVMDAKGRALYFSRYPIPFVRDADFAGDAPLRWRHIGLYGYRRRFLERLVATPPCVLEKAERLEQLRALHIGARIKVLETRYTGIGIDTPADLEAVEKMIRKQVS